MMKPILMIEILLTRWYITLFPIISFVSFRSTDRQMDRQIYTVKNRDTLIHLKIKEGKMDRQIERQTNRPRQCAQISNEKTN